MTRMPPENLTAGAAPVARGFVHLRLHTEFSVVDGTLRIDDAAAAARADGMPALGISDLNNLFGAVKFYKACRAKGIKPVIGVDVWMEPLAQAGFVKCSDKAASRLMLLVQDERGWHHLSELLARAWVSNAQRTVAWVSERAIAMNSRTGSHCSGA